MLKTVILVTDDADHTVTIHPNDNIMEKLEYMLGNINEYRFTVNNKQLTNASEYLIDIPQNSTIKATRIVTRGTPLSRDADGIFRLKSTKDASRPVIEINTVHLSCSSDSYDPNKNFAGMIIYSYHNNPKFEFNGHRCRTGYMLVKDSGELTHVGSDQGQVHGKLFKWFFGCEHNEKFVCAGFAIQKGRIKYNSSVFNCKDDDYHDNQRQMGSGEIGLVTYALQNLYMNHAWKSNQNMVLKNIPDNQFAHLDNLPPENLPNQMRN